LRVTIKPRIHAAIFFLLIGLTMSGTAYSQVPQIERDALVALYNSTDGANWKTKTGWLGAAGTECDWYGVTCSSGSVSRIDLSDNSLSGSIPAELGNLTNLTYLNLSTNSLTGSIPAELGNLSKLITLYLGNNSLSGSIPAELGNLTNLTRLYLYNNSLSGSIPEELGNLTKLTSLNLNSNKFSRPKPAWLNSFTISDNAFDPDADQDGIDDAIDTNLNSVAMIKRIIEPDYSLSILGSGRVVNIVSA
jgi:Ran GTPase-activating protein (RanGAP) involved in mRNA processing and transport